MSVDPVTFLDTGNSEQPNRYSYVSNNPVNLIDPTGMVERDVERKYTEIGSRTGNLSQGKTESLLSCLSESFFSQNDGANFACNATDVSFVDSKGSFKLSGADYDRTESARDKVNIAHQIGVGIRGNGRGGPQSPIGYSEAVDGSGQANFEQMSDAKNVFHRQGRGGEGNSKFVSQDGKHEAVYDTGGNLVTNDVNQGTYNFASPNDNPVGHAILDVLPYYAYGNSPNDPTSFKQRLTADYKRDVNAKKK